MKRTFLSLCLLAVLASAATAQTEVVLHLAPKLGPAGFQLGQVFDHPTSGYPVTYTRFEYYISEIKVVHDGGQVAEAAGVHLLVRPALASEYNLGQMAGVVNVEAVTFSVGVEEKANHSDPTIYAPDDPLAPQNPEMQWGWAAGYRFAAIEGDAGTDPLHFEIHTLGDQNYHSQTIATSAEQVAPGKLVIHLNADYARAIENLKVSTGILQHGTSGNAATLIENFQKLVFTAATPAAVVSPGFDGAFSVSPNPVTGGEARAEYVLPTGGGYEVVVSDLAGRVVSRRDAVGQSVLLEKTPSEGVFIVRLLRDGKPLAAQKLVVLN